MKPVILSEGELKECLGSDRVKPRQKSGRYVFKQRIHPIAYILAASFIAYVSYTLITGYVERWDVRGERLWYVEQGLLEDGLVILPQEPTQVNYSFRGYRGVLEKVGGYSVTAVVLDKRFHTLVKSSAPADLLLVWGEFARPENDKYFSYSMVFDGGGFHVSGDAPTHLRSPLESRVSYSHTRVYPASQKVWDGLKSISGKQVVHIEGYLVDGYLEGVGLFETSTMLTDHGEGSCELVLAESITVGGRTYGGD